METAVSWERAAGSDAGLPASIAALFRTATYGAPVLLLAVAEHKVELPGGDAASQCDVWALLNTSAGTLSLSVEAKANEPFGDATLEDWLVAGGTDQSVANRKRRWDYIRTNLPESASYDRIRYQLLHRCAAAVIEARRFDLQHAAFIVQAFDTPDKSFRDYEAFCHAMGIPAARGSMAATSVGDVTLSIGWADCPAATDAEVAANA